MKDYKCDKCGKELSIDLLYSHGKAFFKKPFMICLQCRTEWRQILGKIPKFGWMSRWKPFFLKWLNETDKEVVVFT